MENLTKEYKVARHVPGYDPAADLTDVEYYDESGKRTEGPEKLLEPRFRLLWFQRYLAEYGGAGMVDDSNVYLVPEANTVIATATVMLNDKVVAKACAGTMHTTADPSVWQSVATQAKGRALAYAGFGTVDAYRPRTERKVANFQESNLRACDYDPAGDIIALPDKDGKPTEVYLNVQYRIHWFNQWLDKQRLVGCIDASEIRYDPIAKMFVATAKVYIDGELVAVSTAARPFDPATAVTEPPVMLASTAAVGRALANAGFGITSNGIDDGRNGNAVPCDAGVKVAPGEAGPEVRPVYQKVYEGAGLARTPKLPPREAPAPENNEPAAPTKKKPGRKPRAATATPAEQDTTPTEQDTPKSEGTAQLPTATREPTQPVTDITAGLPPMPKDEAMKFVMPVGANKGKTLAEILGMAGGINSIKFYASSKFNNPKYVDLARAAKAVMAE